MINYKGETNTKQGEEEVNSRNYNEPHPMKDTHPIDPGDAHDNYLMLISGTNVEEDQNNGVIFTETPDHIIDSSSQDEGEEGTSEDGDYEDEMSTEGSDDFESLDSESP
ncbi:hypothetical protein FXO38_22677 [Capsicum annuum]|nr:hypothetical protein FXO37_34449 [Capsicum annuum]KAF3639396.1 hypothetical protein FXO38_22677 [Capsicum annuum]